MKKKTTLIAGIILVVVIVLAGLAAMLLKPETTKGEKEIAVVVVHGDGSEKTFTYDTDAEYLGEVLLANELVEGETTEYGLYIKAVDGETADDAKQQWWCITKEGGQVNTGADTTPIQDGDQYELTLTEGY